MESCKKECKKCSEVKECGEYRKSVKTEDKKDVWCKICRRVSDKKTYENNIYKNRENGKINKRKLRDRNRNFVYEYLLEHPCVDCGNKNPIVLEFDHMRDKENIISEMIMDGFSLKKIKEEIEKCQVRCANCHRIKTAIQANTFKNKINE